MSCFFLISDESTDDELAVISIAGEVDYSASPQLRAHLATHIDAGRRHLVLDLSTATFIDSTAIGVLMAANARLRSERGGSLAIVCGEGPGGAQPVTWAGESNRVREIFHITGLEAEVSLCDTREEAMRELAIAG